MASVRRWRWTIVGYLVLRWLFAASPGYEADVAAYKRWALYAARDGLTQVYRVTDFDYPPLYAYLLWPIGAFYGMLSPEALETSADSTLLTLMIKLPPLLFDLAIAWLLYRIGRTLPSGGWPIPWRRRAADEESLPTPRPPGPDWSYWLPLSYLLNPAVLFDTAYWGQPDCIHSFFVLYAFVALPTAAWPAGIALALGILMKPLAVPYLPLVLVLALAWHGWRKTLLAVFAGAATLTLFVLPFAIHNGGWTFLSRLVGDTQLMPYTSVNAHNLWWALGGWANATLPYLGPLTAKQVGFVLLGLWLAGLLALAHHAHHGGWRRLDRPRLVGVQGVALAMALGVGFFILSTHLHENHMFIAVPLVLPLLATSWRGSNRRLAIALVAMLSIGFLLNVWPHDPWASGHAPLSWGGPTSEINQHLKRPFLAGQLFVTRLGTTVNLLAFALLSFWLFRPGPDSLLRALRRASRPTETAASE